MNLMFSYGWFCGWNLSQLMPLGIRIIPAKLAEAITATRRKEIFDPVEVFRTNERTCSFRLPKLTPRFSPNFPLVGQTGC